MVAGKDNDRSFHPEQKHQSHSVMVVAFVCLILGGSFPISSASLLQTLEMQLSYSVVLISGHSCKKYDFLPESNFLFMSECRSREGYSGSYLIHHHGSTPDLMMQDVMKLIAIILSKIPVQGWLLLEQDTELRLQCMCMTCMSAS